MPSIVPPTHGHSQPPLLRLCSIARGIRVLDVAPVVDLLSVAHLSIDFHSIFYGGVWQQAAAG